MLNCEIPEEIEVMRKNVLDGSNTSGFQRTALVGLNGWLETSFGKVGITNVCIEEEAAKIIGEDKKKGVYGLNRLGIPLVEIGTSPDIHTPEQAKEVAEKIGMVLRSTDKIMRGIGTIRQDVNVSIRGGSRCEIKGVQKLNLVPKIVELEAQRQKAVVSKGKKVTKDVRKALPSGRTEFMRPLPGAARMYPETDVTPIRVTDAMLKKIRKSLPEFMSDRQKRLVKQHKINEEIAKQLVKSGKAALFEELEKLEKHENSKLAIMLLTSTEKQIRDIPDKKIIELFRALEGRQVSKEAFWDIANKVARNLEKDVKEFVKSVMKSTASEDEVRAEVRKLIKQKKGLSFSAYMGLVMKVFRGRADGKLIAKVLKEELKE
jgi:Glu-tRNA(Gln) amidotransferase subunit E-like FAD-binding protein